MRFAMKPRFTLLILVGLLSGGMAPGAFAQHNPVGLLGQRPAVRLSILPVVQVWEGEGREDYFGELSIPLALQIPFGRAVSLSLRGSGAAVEGTNLEYVSGLADAQAALSVRQEIGGVVVLVSVGASLPSGKKELTAEEFSTTLLLSRNIFRFQVPSFGQGFGVAPGLLVAVPVGDRFVIGLGGSYQVKGAYRPLATFDEDYDPGDELSITGGFDARLGPTTYFSSDVLFTRYGRDKLGQEEVFGAGNKVVVSAQFRQFVGFHELWLFGRYRSRAKNEIAINDALVEESEKSVPDQAEVMGHFRIRFSPGVYARLMGEGRFFDQTRFAGGMTLYGVGIGPEFVFSRAVTLPLRFKYYFGDYRGGEASLGLVLAF